eukprot:s1182_g35.t3
MASELLREAQEGLDDLHPEGFGKASEAVDLFRRDGDKFGVYDALRAMVSYHRQSALRDGRKPLEALKLAEDQLEDFRRSGDLCGEACMLLSLAEMNMDRRGRKKREEALESCQRALAIFQEQRATKYEVMAQLILTNLYFKLEQPLKAQQASEVALSMASSPRSVGKALHAQALALAAMGRYGTAAAKAAEAGAVFRQEGDRKMQASQLVSVAQWSLKASDFFAALKASEEALRIFQQPGYGKGWQSKALGLLCESLVALNQAPKAAKLAKEFQAQFEKDEDPNSAARALQLQGYAWSGSGTPERALEPLQAASEAPVTEKGWRGGILQDHAASFLAGGDSTAALQKLSAAVLAARSERDRRGEARALRRIFRVHWERGDVQAARNAAEDARAVAKASGDIRGEAQDLLRLALAQQDILKALEAMDLCSAARDARGEAEALKVLSELRRSEGQLDAALEAAEERLSIIRNLGDLHLEAQALLTVSQLHLALGSVSDATETAQQGLQLSRQNDEPRGRGLRVQLLLLLVELGVEQLEQLEEPQARRKLLRWSAEALALAGKVGDQSLRTLALYWRAYVWGILGRPSSGLSFAREARDLCRKLEHKPSEARCWLMIAQLLFAQGSREEALDAASTAQHLAASCGDLEAEVEVQNFKDSLSKKEVPPAAETPSAPSPAAASPAAPSPAAPEASQGVVSGKGGLKPEEVGRQLIGFVKELTSGTEEVELDTAFIDAGMDSLSGVSLVSMLNRDFQVALTPSVVFDYPTIRMLQEYLISESQEYANPPCSDQESVARSPTLYLVAPHVRNTRVAAAMPGNELAILEEFEQRFQRLESTVQMLIDTHLPERLSALEARRNRGDDDDRTAPREQLGISLEGDEVEDLTPESRNHRLSGPLASPSQTSGLMMKTHTDGTTSHLRTFFSQHTATSLVNRRQTALPDVTPPEHYRFVESTWDLMIFVGTPQLGTLGSLQTLALVLLTIAMQAVFVGIAVNNFLDPVVSDQTVSDALQWRRTSAHAFKEYDSVIGKSLGERVCGGDKSLHLSGIQMSLYDEIRTYLRTDSEGFSTFFNGQSMCIVALLCWYMMVAKEISQALALHRGILTVNSGKSDIEPRENPFTQIMHFRLNFVSPGRKLLSSILLIYRLLAAGILVYVGSFFLVYTINVTELILNSVSLGIILDIDNYIFQAMASSAGRDLMNYLEPLRVPSYRRFGGSDAKSAFM